MIEGRLLSGHGISTSLECIATNKQGIKGQWLLRLSLNLSTAKDMCMCALCNAYLSFKFAIMSHLLGLQSILYTCVNCSILK